MKKVFWISLLLMGAIMSADGSWQTLLVQKDEAVLHTAAMTEEPNGSAQGESTPEHCAMQAEKLILSVDGKKLNVRWESNETVAELMAYARRENIVVHTTRYGGFEQVGSLPQEFSRNDVQMTTGPGDVVLYSGNQLVLFFGSNSWSYTKLGAIEGLCDDALSVLLDQGSTVVEITSPFN